ncbi:MAG: hypothetical protein JNJ44_09820 [Zoogloeaceae bacterium]|nr:hypothetical protein [Zoogloeaceae bacterium]
MAAPPITLCPSAQPDWQDARVFAVVGGTPDRPETAYLDQAEPVTPELLALASPVAPAEVFRIAAPCAQGACQHFDNTGHACRLAQKTVGLMPIAFEKLPRCAIRADCRWWQQEGASACRRCPQVVTVNFTPTRSMRQAADPDVISATPVGPDAFQPAA